MEDKEGGGRDKKRSDDSSWRLWKEGKEETGGILSLCFLRSRSLSKIEIGRGGVTCRG